MTGPDPLRLHASCVAIGERGLLILGPSGSGKSSLALQMMALGAELVADDQVELRLRGDLVLARSPEAIRGMIESRQVGILNAPARTEVPVLLVVDLDQQEDERLPEKHGIVFFGQRLDLVKAAEVPHFPASLLFYLRHGRRA